MERLAVIEARMRSLHQLRDVIGAMRSVAAAHLQQASDALPAARRYGDIVDDAFAQALGLLSPSTDGAEVPPALGVIVFTAEHGFVGGFNRVLAEEVRRIAPRRLFAVGTRGAAVLRETGLTLDWWGPAAVNVPTIMDVGRRVTDDVYRLFDSHGLGRLDMLFGRLLDDGTWAIAQEPLLPLDPTRYPPRPGATPLHYLAPDDLLERLVEEHLLADVVRGTTEALAAENAARLQAMSSAFDNIDHTLDDLEARHRQVRQDQITEELLDLISVRRGGTP